MKFRTEIKFSPDDIRIEYQNKILSLGSCFADRMGHRLADAKIPTLTNPLGIVYNPISICKLFDYILPPYQSPEIEQASSGLWHSFDLHSKMSGTSEQDLRQKIQKCLQDTSTHLVQSKLLILTFGTAYIYKRKDNQQIVANCHKYPANFFEKSLLEVEEIVQAFEKLIPQLKTQNPSLKILLTVSPIRHIKEGLANNMLSKSMLRVACAQLCDRFQDVHYFPAYEIMLDDLRDYRYYQDDLIHPNNFAEQYIWEKLVENYFSEDAKNTLKKWLKLQKGIGHRPLHGETEQYKLFLQKLIVQLDEISGVIDCREELKEVTKRLSN